jgi:phosphoadenosine phosphosulfate reductase
MVDSTFSFSGFLVFLVLLRPRKEKYACKKTYKSRFDVGVRVDSSAFFSRRLSFFRFFFSFNNGKTKRKKEEVNKEQPKTKKKRGRKITNEPRDERKRKRNNREEKRRREMGSATIPATATSSTTTTTIDFDLELINQVLEEATPEERIQWALDHLGPNVVLSTSFGTQSAVMLHMASKLKPDLKVIFINTGYHFTETLTFAQQLTRRLNLNLHVYSSLLPPEVQEERFGRLWEQGLEGLLKYNYMNKIEPIQRALGELQVTGWLTGIRRSQASSRAELKVVQVQDGIVKAHPLVDWSNRQIHYYLKAHDLPYHPLWDQGYVSVGDWHSTVPLSEGMTEEETRFGGVKRECGLHESREKTCVVVK